jgi:hypothetical protein
MAEYSKDHIPSPNNFIFGFLAWKTVRNKFSLTITYPVSGTLLWEHEMNEGTY